MAIPLSYSIRSLWGRQATTIATAGGIGMVVFVLAASQMLAAGMRNTLLRAGSPNHALIMQHDAYYENGSRIRDSVLLSAAGAPGVRRDPAGKPLVSGEALVQILVQRRGDVDRLSSVQVRGVGDNAYALRPYARIVEGRPPHPGADEAIIGKGIAGAFRDLAIGGQFALKKGRPIKIVGTFEARGSAFESEVWTGLDVVRTSLGWDGLLSSVTAVLEAPSDYDRFALALQMDRSQGLSVARERAYYEKVSEGLASSVQMLGTLITVIFAIGALLGAAITMNAAIAQRQREIGVLRALGFSAWHVLAAFLLESGALALCSAAFGVALASLLSFARLTITNYGTGNEVAFPFDADPAIMFRSLAAGVLVGILGGFFPALRTSRTSPIVACRA